MALSRVQYEADGSTDTFSVTFPYITKSDVKVSVGGNPVSFTWPTDSSVKISPVPSAGAIIDIKRETERENILVDFQDGSTLLENDLDLSARQSFYLAQESFDQTGSTMSVANDGSLSASGRKVSSLGYPDSDDDAATQGYVKDVLTDGENASEKATEAENWANYPEDQLVPEGNQVDDYSSLHHKEKALNAQLAAEDARDVSQQSAIESADSATAASNSEGNAADSASAAAQSESNAADSETNTASIYNDFVEKYLGSKSSEPTTDNNGDPLLDGALYYNTTDGTVQVYDADAGVWKNAGSSVSSYYSRQDYVATDGQTTFPVQYDPPFVEVIVNGDTLPPSDYTASNGTGVVLNQGVPSGTEVSLIGLGSFQVADTYSRSETYSIDEADAQFAPITRSRKNLLINGGFDVWQRGEELQAISPESPFVADRWRLLTSGAEVDVYKGEYTSLGNPFHYIRFKASVVDDLVGIEQRIENPQVISGKTVTLSGLAYSDSPCSLRLYTDAEMDDGSATLKANSQEGSDIAITGGEWVPFSWTFVAPDYSASTSSGPGDNLGVSVRRVEALSDNMRFAQMQLEIGDAATDFEQRPIGEELALCQRYYYVCTDKFVGLAWYGVTNGANDSMYGIHNFPVSMRAAPSVTLVNVEYIAFSSLNVFRTDRLGVSAVGLTSSANDRGYFLSEFEADAEL